MSAKVDKVNLGIYKYQTYTHNFRVWADDDKTSSASVSGSTAKLEFRDEVDGTVLFTATTSNGYLSVGVYIVTLKIPSDVVKAWTFISALYDLFVISSEGDATPIARGTVTITPSITHLP